MVFSGTGKTVATVTVGADGHFTATAPLPAKKLRNSNKARYVARIGSEASLALKLARRMLVTKVAAAGNRVTIAGKVIGPLATRPKDRTITLQRVVACKKRRDGEDVRAGQERRRSRSPSTPRPARRQPSIASPRECVRTRGRKS